jgi:hypothetical protein
LLEQAIHQRGFAMIDVGNDGDITNIGTDKSANDRSPQLFFYSAFGEGRLPWLLPWHARLRKTDI